MSMVGSIDQYGPIFMEVAEKSLERFRVTDGQCVSLCAHMSLILQAQSVPHCIILGSLSCCGVKTFQYKKAFPRRPIGGLAEWEGHAWLSFPGDLVGDASLIRTARVQSQNSNLRIHLESVGLLAKGGFLLGRQELAANGLKYTRKRELKNIDLRSLVRGLELINGY